MRCQDCEHIPAVRTVRKNSRKWFRSLDCEGESKGHILGVRTVRENSRDMVDLGAETVRGNSRGIF